MKTLLKNGYVYNGNNERGEYLDILIEGEKILKIGKNIECEECNVVDCTNLTIAPGFIDAHSHNDFFVTRNDSEKFITPFLEQGITTQVVGNCGFSTYTIDKNSEHLDLIGGGLFKNDFYSSLHDFKNEVLGKLFLNVVPLIGHGSARCSVSGYKNSSLSYSEMKEMLKLVEKDLEDGAFGGSFGLMYEPGIYAPIEELTEFANLIKKYDGILTVHPRACSNISMSYPLYKKHHIELGFDELAEVVRKTKVRFEYSHLIFTGEKSWPRVDSMLRRIKNLQNEGIEVGYDMYPYTYGASVITVFLPSNYLSLPKEKRSKGFLYRKIKMLLSVTKVLLGLSFDDMTIAYISDDKKEYEGKTISEIAKMWNISAADAYLRLVEMSDGKGRILMDKYYNQEIIEKLMRDENSIFMTDAWYEEKGVQNSSTYSAYPLFLLKANDYHLPLEYVINKMTKKVAERFRIPLRGELKDGFFADITIFDEKALKVNGKGDCRCDGIKYVYVNGVLAVKDGIYTGRTAGKVLQK